MVRTCPFEIVILSHTRNSTLHIVVITSGKSFIRLNILMIATNI